MRHETCHIINIIIIISMIPDPGGSFDRVFETVLESLWHYESRKSVEMTADLQPNSTNQKFPSSPKVFIILAKKPRVDENRFKTNAVY